MKAYKYNEELNEVDSRTVYIDQKTGEYMVKEGWTLIEPPVKDGLIYKNVGDKWNEFVDNRGDYFDTVTGNKTTVNNPFQDISTLTKIEKPEGFYKWSIDKWIVDDVTTQENSNSINRQYLSSTDWYIIRFQETEEAIPTEISELRAIARASII